jgi:hypothetical protein
MRVVRCNVQRGLGGDVSATTLSKPEQRGRRATVGGILRWGGFLVGMAALATTANAGECSTSTNHLDSDCHLLAGKSYRCAHPFASPFSDAPPCDLHTHHLFRKENREKGRAGSAAMTGAQLVCDCAVHPLLERFR